MVKYIIAVIILLIVYSIFDDWNYERELYKNSGLEKRIIKERRYKR